RQDGGVRARAGRRFRDARSVCRRKRSRRRRDPERLARERASRGQRSVHPQERRFEEHARRARGELAVALLAWIVHWSLRNRAVVVMATLVFIAFAIHAAIELPLDAVPDVTNVQVQVITTAPALSPVEVEQYVTVPVERAMAGIPHSTEVR